MFLGSKFFLKIFYKNIRTKKVHKIKLKFFFEKFWILNMNYLCKPLLHCIQSVIHGWYVIGQKSSKKIALLFERNNVFIKLSWFLLTFRYYSNDLKLTCFGFQFQLKRYKLSQNFFSIGIILRNNVIFVLNALLLHLIKFVINIVLDIKLVSKEL